MSSHNMHIVCLGHVIRCPSRSLLLGRRAAAGDTPKDSTVSVEMIPLEHGPSFQL